MEGLRRSAVSFRRQGSSGLVWEDRFISGELAQPENQEQRFFSGDLSKPSRSQQAAHDHHPAQRRDLKVKPIKTGRSAAEGRRRTVTDDFQAVDPPSPKLSACGCCGGFGRPTRSGRPTDGKPRQA
ncbi:hypothetical protein Nepgr_019496 [Nepenthes gracilis]|uniref:MAPK kinase substrate protein At1g80180-like n=1 Tax=Nepenthes gracilis TaxID=150966 RepID=A0AAD3XVA9_NEPGR|nr:hypothetical protein Nepgr_019496 [Nepenthes gracilis]